MRNRLAPAFAGILLLICGSAAHAQPQSSDGGQEQLLNGAYRGTLVCEHLPGTVGILRGPLDIVVTGTTSVAPRQIFTVVAARPIFNRDGSRVVGTEIATGTLNADGALHLTSNWTAAGAGFKGTYSGTLSASGGTISGTQVWRRSSGNDGNISRTCYGAFVKSPPESR